MACVCKSRNHHVKRDDVLSSFAAICRWYVSSRCRKSHLGRTHRLRHLQFQLLNVRVDSCYLVPERFHIACNRAYVLLERLDPVFNHLHTLPNRVDVLAYPRDIVLDDCYFPEYPLDVLTDVFQILADGVHTDQKPSNALTNDLDVIAEHHHTLDDRLHPLAEDMDVPFDILYRGQLYRGQKSGKTYSDSHHLSKSVSCAGQQHIDRATHHIILYRPVHLIHETL